MDAGADAGPAVTCEDPVLPMLGEEPIAPVGSFDSPLFVTQAPDADDTLWVVERIGRIRLVRGGAILPTDFLDIRTLVTTEGNEQGLLGLAFHPDYATNGRFFVAYTAGPNLAPDRPGPNIVAEYRRSATDPERADPAEVRRLVEQADIRFNHNGGMLAFGPDRFLYVAMGDGGGSCDTGRNAQRRNTLLGKLLRLDVDNVAGMFAAAGNPFTLPEGLPQIWAYGLRNPWRFSFDRLTGDLWIGDVGQNAKEELDFQPAGAAGGANYGWEAFEGDVSASISCGRLDTIMGNPHTPPLLIVNHGSATEVVRSACSIIGGYVYRGSAIPELRGVYVFGDYCSPDVAAFRYCDGAIRGWQRIPGIGRAGDLVSFGEDNRGELYLVYIAGRSVTRLVARAP
jgi:glucose/arabinose dehydrogenase